MNNLQAKAQAEFVYHVIQSYKELVKKYNFDMLKKASDGINFTIRGMDKVLGANYTSLKVLENNKEDELKGALWTAEKLSQKGIDAIEVSSGTGASGALTPVRTKILSQDKEAYNLEVALAIKEHVSCPVMVVGGFRSLGMVRNAIEEMEIDFISMSRPLIREPNLPMRWEQGDQSPATCISCNKCFQGGLFKGGIFCVPAMKKEK